MRLSTGRTILGAAAVITSAGILAAGSALRPASAADNVSIHPDGVVTCSSASWCEKYDNTSTGQAIEGETGKGIGVYGDATKTGIGVEGISSDYAGLYANGTDYGSINVSGSLEAIYGYGPEGLVAVSDNASDTAIESYSDGGNIFEGYDSSNTAVLTIDNDGDVGSNGDVEAGSSSINFGGQFSGEYDGVIGSSPYGDAVYATGGGNLFVGNNSENSDVFVVDQSGDVMIDGYIFTAGSCSSGCVKQASDPGKHIVKYAPTVSEPMTEDFGEGQLTSGSGYVHLDATFAKTIDEGAGYLVFITPEGNSNGVYVTQKSASGFAVRENNDGHSTLAFSWRIVAKPYGVSAPRLPTVNVAADPRGKSAITRQKIVKGTLRHVLPAAAGR